MESSAVIVTDRKRKDQEQMVLRLYVAGDAPNSTRARANLRRLLSDVDPSLYQLEVIDCLDVPLRALEDGVLVTPTLMRVRPEPRQVVVGTLSAPDRVAEALKIEVNTLPQGDGATHE